MAIDTKVLNAMHISAQYDDAYEAARSGFFTLIVNDIDNIIKSTAVGEKATNANSYANAQNNIQLSVVQCNVPHFSTTPLTYRRGNDEVKFAGVPSFDTGSLVVDDMLGLDSKGILMAWQAQTYDVKTRKGGRMKNYKKTCTLVEYTQDYEQVRAQELHGCWPSQITESPFNREQDGKRQVTATIQYDYAIMLDEYAEPTA